MGPDLHDDSRAVSLDAQLLIELARMKMPFGKYTGRRLIDLPEPYMVWFSQSGFPRGRLGEMLRIVYEIKVNGLEYLFDPLR
jgi:uncharacterized protein (DUF3820 family)